MAFKLNIHTLTYYLFLGNTIYLIINEYKSKKHGVSVDGYGNVIKRKNKNSDDGNINSLLLKNKPSKNAPKGILKEKDNKNYKDITSYKTNRKFNL